MKFMRLFLTLVVLILLTECSAYRILGVFPINGKSHSILFQALMKGLARHGHQVDVITHFPLKKPMKNYKDIISLDGSMAASTNNFTIDFTQFITEDIVRITVEYFGNKVCDFMGFENMQALIRNPPTNPPYDAVIVEAFTSNCYFGFGYVFKVPVIAISSAIEYPWVSEFIGNNDNLAIVPNAFHDRVGKMTYWERFMNVITYYLQLRKFYVLTEDYQTKAMRTYLSPNIPSIREIEKNISLILVNNDPIISGIKPIVPTLIQIAGLHIEDNNETLIPELKKWMDESTHGVVYFSLGSMVVIESMAAELLDEILTSFGKIAPIRVLIKIADQSKMPPGLPKNVKTMTWIPQIPLLAHPNMKIFMTHGGLGSLQEALYYGVPMIGLPLFADQFMNCKRFVAKEMMVQIEFKKLSEQVLDSAIQKIIRNPVYKEKAAYYSKLFKDRPISRMNNAIYWIEYVIRNGQILRPPALDMTWLQLSLLDVYGMLLLIFISGFAIILISIKLIIKVAFKILTNNSVISLKKTN